MHGGIKTVEAAQGYYLFANKVDDFQPIFISTNSHTLFSVRQIACEPLENFASYGKT